MFNIFLFVFLLFSFFIVRGLSSLIDPKEGRHTDEGRSVNKRLMHCSVGALIAAVMKSDGQCTKGELEVAKTFLKKCSMTEKDQIEVLHYIRYFIKTSRNSIGYYTQPLCTFCTYRYRLALVDTLYHIATVTNGISYNEWQLLGEICGRLMITAMDQNDLNRHYNKYSRTSGNSSSWQYSRTNGGQSGYRQHAGTQSNPSVKSCYDTLGLKEGCSMEAVKKAYRKLAMVYHPDKAPAEKKAAYQQKFIEIKKAYESICSHN